MTVLHTHNRRLDFHPHVHLVIPAVAFDTRQRLWRNKNSGYLFCHKALAKVFRARMLDGIKRAGLKLPDRYPEDWVVDCKAVGSGDKALVYLGRYLYRGVLPEKNIVSNRDGNVTFRYQDSETRKMKTRTLSGVAFLRLLRKADADRAYAGEVRGEGIAQPGAESGGHHVNRRTPQTCCDQQVRINSP